MKQFAFSRLALCVLCGASIFVVPGLASAGWFPLNSGTIYGLNSVNFPVDIQTGYIVGDYDYPNGYLMKTTNGGVSWIRQNPPTYRSLESVQFPVDAMTGYIVGYVGTIIKTTDGGANWVAQTSGTTNDLMSVNFPVNTTTGYAVGRPAIILKTTNGGTNWVTQYSDTTDLRSVFFDEHPNRLRRRWLGYCGQCGIKDHKWRG